MVASLSQALISAHLSKAPVDISFVRMLCIMLRIMCNILTALNILNISEYCLNIVQTMTSIEHRNEL